MEKQNKNKLKILASGDLHGDSQLAEKLAQQADKEKADLVVLCGDLTLQDTSTDNLIGPFKKRNLEVAFVPGNHDSQATADFLTEFYKIKNLHGYYLKLKDVGLFGCGFANIGLNQISDKETFNILKKGYQKIKDKKKKIMVTHAHPEGTLMENLTQVFPGSKGIKKAIDTFKPDLLLCSHVHEAEGIEEKVNNTQVINVGRKGKLIEL